MSFVEYIIDFFKRLIRSRVDSVQIKGKTAVKNVEYRAKSKVANSFNKAVDGAVDKTKDKFTRKKPEDDKADDAEVVAPDDPPKPS